MLALGESDQPHGGTVSIFGQDSVGSDNCVVQLELGTTEVILIFNSIQITATVKNPLLFRHWVLSIICLTFLAGCKLGVENLRQSFCAQLNLDVCNDDLFERGAKLIDALKPVVADSPLVGQAIKAAKLKSKRLETPKYFDFEAFDVDYELTQPTKWHSLPLDGALMAKGWLFLPNLCVRGDEFKRQLCLKTEVTFSAVSSVTTLRIDSSTLAGIGLIAYYKECEKAGKACYVDFAGDVRAVKQDDDTVFGWASLVWFSPHVPTREALIEETARHVAIKVLSKLRARPLPDPESFSWLEFIDNEVSDYLSIRN